MTLIIQLSNAGARQIAECNGIRVSKSKGGTIHELARKLQEAGERPQTPVIVKRGETVCFNPAPLSHWADNMIYESDKGFRLIRWDYEAINKLRHQRQEVSQ